MLQYRISSRIIKVFILPKWKFSFNMHYNIIYGYLDTNRILKSHYSMLFLCSTNVYTKQIKNRAFTIFVLCFYCYDIPM